jgi:hypothetical protein
MPQISGTVNFDANKLCTPPFGTNFSEKCVQGIRENTVFSSSFCVWKLLTFILLSSVVCKNLGLIYNRCPVFSVICLLPPSLHFQFF